MDFAKNLLEKYGWKEGNYIYAMLAKKTCFYLNRECTAFALIMNSTREYLTKY